MDSYNIGATYHKCDLQVHTLRDENHSSSFDAVSDRDVKNYPIGYKPTMFIYLEGE